MGAEENKQQEPQPNDPQGAQEPPQEPQGGDGGQEPQGSQNGGAEPPVTDSHGQPGINKERHDKEVAELKAEIDALKAEAAEAAEQKSKREEYERKAADLEAKLADSNVVHSLELAGCRNVKAAKALLGDYGGDVAKLKADCPYLFDDKKTGSTGFKPEGAPDPKREAQRKAREAAGTAKYYKDKE